MASIIAIDRNIQLRLNEAEEAFVLNNHYHELNPFTAVWLRTRETVRHVIDERPTSFIVLLVILSGIAAALLGTLDTQIGETMPVWGIILTSVVFGPLVGVIATGFISMVFLVIGKLFKGTADYKEVFRAVVTAQITQIWLAPLLLVWMIVSPETYFLETEETAVTSGDIGLSLVLSIVLAVVSIWTLVVQSKALGEAHGLSSWKGFFILIIPVVLLTILFILLAVVFIAI